MLYTIVLITLSPKLDLRASSSQEQNLCWCL